MERIVEHVGNEWRCDLHDGAGTVLVTRDKGQMEEALDYLEATGRLGKDAIWPAMTAGTNGSSAPTKWGTDAAPTVRWRG